MNLAQLITTIVLAVIGATGGIGGILVAIFKHIWKKQMKAKEDYDKLREEKRVADRQKEVRSIVREEITTVKNELMEENIEFREKIDSIQKDVEIHKEGTQAMLRNELYELSDKWSKEGYAPRDVKQNFENLYSKYHKMGKNGVMDGCHERFMALPDEPTKKLKKSGGK